MPTPETPAAARQRWHTEARERDDACVATLPDDDTETSDSPWASGFPLTEPEATFDAAMSRMARRSGEAR